MGKKVLKPVGMVVIALILLVLIFMLRGSLRGPARVVLPEETANGENISGADDGKNDAINRVDIRPSTVQDAIAVLERPQQYYRTIVIERYYSGGSCIEQAEVFVSGGWTRVDLTKDGAESRHVISNGKTSYIWYGGSKSYYTGASSLSADEEQSIPTYEDILRMDVQRIALADYRLLDTKDCIYVETVPDSAGYVERYWVCVSDGLLVAAEKVCGEEVVYRMASMNADTENAMEEAFVLPDGTQLHPKE